MFYSQYIYPDTGFEFNANDMQELEDHLERLMDDVCDVAADAWQDEERRQAVAYHLITEHELDGPGVSSFIRMMDIVHIYRQVADGEEEVGVVYQRRGI